MPEPTVLNLHNMGHGTDTVDVEVLACESGVMVRLPDGTTLDFFYTDGKFKLMKYPADLWQIADTVTLMEQPK